PNRIDTIVTLGTTEEWIVTDTTGDVHPFHIHENSLQVIAINGVPQQVHSYHDTVDIPARGTLTLRIRFEDFVGKTVYHCHILSHEDPGMMGVLQIVEPASAPTPTASPTSPATPSSTATRSPTPSPTSTPTPTPTPSPTPSPTASPTPTSTPSPT